MLFRFGSSYMPSNFLEVSHFLFHFLDKSLYFVDKALSNQAIVTSSLTPYTVMHYPLNIRHTDTYVYTHKCMHTHIFIFKCTLYHICYIQICIYKHDFIFKEFPFPLVNLNKRHRNKNKEMQIFNLSSISHFI